LRLQSGAAIDTIGEEKRGGRWHAKRAKWRSRIPYLLYPL